MNKLRCLPAPGSRRRQQDPVLTINQVWGLQAALVSVEPQSVSDGSVSGVKQQMDTRGVNGGLFPSLYVETSITLRSDGKEQSRLITAEFTLVFLLLINGSGP